MGLTKSISENRYENSCPRQDSDHSQSSTEMASGVNVFGCWPWPTTKYIHTRGHFSGGLGMVAVLPRA